MMMLIMKRCPQVVSIDSIDFFLKLVSDCVVAHDIVEHASQHSFIFNSSISRVDPTDLEDFPIRPGNIFRIQQFIAKRTTIFNDKLFGKTDHITQPFTSTSTITSNDTSSLTPLELNISLKITTIDDNSVITYYACLLFRITIEKFRSSIEDRILGCLTGVEGYTADVCDFLLDVGKGTIELVLLTQGVTANQVKMTRRATLDVLELVVLGEGSQEERRETNQQQTG